MKRAALLAVLVCSACGGAATRATTIVRTQAGTPVAGPPISASSYEAFLRAERAVALGAWPEAVGQYRLALASSVEDPYVLARLAVALAHTERMDAAEQALARAERLDHESEAAAMARGEIAVLHDDRDAAAAAFARATALAPSSPRGALALADVLVRAGDPRRAIDVLSRFAGTRDADRVAVARARLHVALAAADPHAAADAVRALEALAPASREEVAATASALLAADPELAYRLLAALPERRDDTALLVRAALASGRRTEAEALLVAHLPDDFGGPTEAARLFLLAARPDRALTLAEAALADGAGPAAERTAGDAALASHQWAVAATHYARVPPGARDFPEAREGLALALEAQGLPALGADLRSAGVTPLGSNAR